jgi:HSP20 family protein
LSVTGWRPRVDVYGNGGTAVIQAELPGVKKEDIDVRGNLLTLRGQRKSEQEVDESGFYCRERFFGSFQRSFTLPETVDPTLVKDEGSSTGNVFV